MKTFEKSWEKNNQPQLVQCFDPLQTQLETFIPVNSQVGRCHQLIVGITRQALSCSVLQGRIESSQLSHESKKTVVLIGILIVMVD